jgi:hypothetical protein
VVQIHSPRLKPVSGVRCPVVGPADTRHPTPDTRFYAPVAQLDRASASGAEGPAFESRLAHVPFSAPRYPPSGDVHAGCDCRKKCAPSRQPQPVLQVSLHGTRDDSPMERVRERRGGSDPIGV